MQGTLQRPEKIKELSYMATVVNTISRHSNPSEVPNDKINDAHKDQIKEFIDTYVWRYTQFFPDLPGEQPILLRHPGYGH
jgi:phage gp36-like protein